MNLQKEFNLILEGIIKFENIATRKEKIKLFNELIDYLKRELK